MRISDGFTVTAGGVDRVNVENYFAQEGAEIISACDQFGVTYAPKVMELLEQAGVGCKLELDNPEVDLMAKLMPQPDVPSMG